MTTSCVSITVKIIVGDTHIWQKLDTCKRMSVRVNYNSNEDAG